MPSRKITFAARGLEELFFHYLCCCVSFLVVAGNGFRCYLPTIPVVLCHCVFFLVAAGISSGGLHRSAFWLWREIVLGVTYLEATWQTACRHFFGKNPADPPIGNCWFLMHFWIDLIEPEYFSIWKNLFFCISEKLWYERYFPSLGSLEMYLTDLPPRRISTVVYVGMTRVST